MRQMGVTTIEKKQTDKGDERSFSRKMNKYIFLSVYKYSIKIQSELAIRNKLISTESFLITSPFLIASLVLF